MIWVMIWAACAVLCFFYGFLVLGTASGTSFWLVWMAMGGILLLFAVCAGFHLWARLPSLWRGGLSALLIACAALFIFVEARILGCFHNVPEPGLDCIVVLGAQIRSSGPSIVLRYRLDTAADYLEQNPDTLCIVSGGQGANEPWPEAVGMRDYLVSRGIDTDRIFMEEKSINTRENLAFSLLLTGPDGNPLIDPRQDTVGIVTNNFHVFRACAIARKSGYRNVSPVPAPSSTLYLPNNLLREFLGVVKDRLAGNL